MGNPANPVSLDDQIACVMRELVMRRRVYKRRVDQGHMTMIESAKEMAAMEAVLETLLSVKEKREPRLDFDHAPD
jgi:hypothetical protein